VPLDATYEAAFAVVPRRWQRVWVLNALPLPNATGETQKQI
jgi:hypothetical protein